MLFDRRIFMAGGAGALLSGCATLRDPGPLRTVSFESLARQIKHDVGTYMFRHQDDVPPSAPPGRPGPAVRCLGQVAFSISKVKLTVTTTTENRAGGGGLQVPLGPASLGLSGSMSRTRNQSVATTLEIFPMRQRLGAVPPAPPGWQGTPITDTLEALAADLIRTADTPPCFDFGVGQGSNTVKWGFTVTDAQSGGVRFSLLLFSLGADASLSQSVANCIEVSFTGAGGAFFIA